MKLQEAEKKERRVTRKAANPTYTTTQQHYALRGAALQAACP